MRISCFSAVPAHLFKVTPARQITHPHRRPAKFGHDLTQPPIGARSAVALRNLEQIQKRLATDALQPVKEIDFATHTLKRQPPRIDGFSRGSFRLFFSQPIPKRQRPYIPVPRTNKRPC